MTDRPWMRKFDPVADKAERERLRTEAEASWRGITELDIRRKLRNLEAHPFRPLLGRMLATAFRRHAPPMLAHLPPEFLDAEQRA